MRTRLKYIESVVAAIAEENRKTAEAHKEIAETHKEIAETHKEIAETHKEIVEENRAYALRRERDRAEWEKRHAELERIVKKASKAVGDHSRNVGSVTEESYYRAFEEHPRIGEIAFDTVNRDIKLPGKNILQLDIVLLNGTVCGVVEVKFKCHINDVHKFIAKRPAMLSALRGACPRDHYLFVIASDEFNKDAISLAYQNGLVVGRRKGSELVIDTSHQRLYPAL